jgi:hypothetical protein
MLQRQQASTIVAAREQLKVRKADPIEDPGEIP